MRLGLCSSGSVHSDIGGYLRKYVVKVHSHLMLSLLQTYLCIDWWKCCTLLVTILLSQKQSHLRSLIPTINWYSTLLLWVTHCILQYLQWYFWEERSDSWYSCKRWINYWRSVLLHSYFNWLFDLILFIHSLCYHKTFNKNWSSCNDAGKLK